MEERLRLIRTSLPISSDSSSSNNNNSSSTATPVLCTYKATRPVPYGIRNLTCAAASSSSSPCTNMVLYTPDERHVYLLYNSNLGDSAAVTGVEVKAVLLLELSSTSCIRYLSISKNGRVFAILCKNGDLQCYDVLQQQDSVKLKLRWCHSIPKSKNNDNTYASLQIVQDLVSVVDDTNGVLYVWSVASGTSLLSSSDAFVTSAVFVPEDMYGHEDENNTPPRMIVGYRNGAIRELSIVENGKILRHLSSPHDNDEWSCTHLNLISLAQDEGPSSSSWALVAGFCHVERDEDNTAVIPVEDYDSDEDDPAMYEATIHIANLTTSSQGIDDEHWFEIGDVAPFFCVPMNGRHMFHSSFMKMGPSAECDLLLVGCNVSSEVGTIVYNRSSRTWEFLDLEGDRSLTTPVTNDDEYAYPIGIIGTVLKDNCTHSSHTGESVAFLYATDGSLSQISFKHETNVDFSKGVKCNNINLLKEAPPLLSVDVQGDSSNEKQSPLPTPDSVGFNNDKIQRGDEGMTPNDISFPIDKSTESSTVLASSTFSVTSSFRNNTPSTSAVFGQTSLPMNINEAHFSPVKSLTVAEKSAPIFGSNAIFGAPSTIGGGFGAFATASTTDQKLFKGKTARELLTEFYSKNNPEKIPEVEKLLNKYKGEEEHLFRNLALKYNIDPSDFGLNVTPTSISSPSLGCLFGASNPSRFSCGRDNGAKGEYFLKVFATIN